MRLRHVLFSLSMRGGVVDEKSVIGCQMPAVPFLELPFSSWMFDGGTLVITTSDRQIRLLLLLSIQINYLNYYSTIPDAAHVTHDTFRPSQQPQRRTITAAISSNNIQPKQPSTQ
jgi:hypothetical protein